MKSYNCISIRAGRVKFLEREVKKTHVLVVWAVWVLAEANRPRINVYVIH